MRARFAVLAASAIALPLLLISGAGPGNAGTVPCTVYPPGSSGYTLAVTPTNASNVSKTAATTLLATLKSGNDKCNGDAIDFLISTDGGTTYKFFDVATTGAGGSPGVASVTYTSPVSYKFVARYGAGGSTGNPASPGVALYSSPGSVGVV